jgi:pimeloyl-ACP methyl ester carboxylesterase
MKRRTMLTGALSAAVVAPAFADAADENATATARFRRRGRAKNYVLVHGAWHGGWCWRDVKAELERSGANVLTPTMTGCGDRGHLRNPVPTLSTHIEDVVNAIIWAEVDDIVLVGHSYGGMVVTGVADQLREKVRHIVYLDAAVPENGQSMISQNPATQTPEAIEASVNGLKTLTADGLWMRAFPPSFLGIPESNAAATAWVARRLTQHPLPSWTQPLNFVNTGTVGIPKTFIWCNRPALEPSAFPAHAARIRSGAAGPDWRYRELATGHDAMVTMPRETARLIREAGR